ncbi:MAG: UDP-N-acetylmuramoyl-L-alanyl-D-glutamate--2,6-diaminopimelate ligase [Deltaproteobacteria bacterium]|nr:UDP-N-acetylmuramoyl-L-alanyl-D-glutamate--2,6-diaminopimelate ligase [Deltaproteobacteria bacterium]
MTRSLSLAELLPELGTDVLKEEFANLQIRGITEDSRHVRPGDLFVAVSGLTVDGHDYAARALAAGAIAILGSRPLDLSIPSLVTKDPSRLLGLAAARLAGNPCQRMRAVGITGTNGKTTTAYLLEAILQGAGRRPGLVGTVAYRFGGRSVPSPFTTPTPVQLQKLLAEMVDARCDHLVMEVSSHGLSLGRVWGCEFDIAAFTHLTQDHLDLHHSMEAYLQAKLLLFTRHLKQGGTALVNIDGAQSERVLDALGARADVRVLCVSRLTPQSAEIALEEVRCSLNGIEATLRLPETKVPLRSPLLGTFNADNLLLAAACAYALGVAPDAIAQATEELPGVPGRLERITLAAQKSPTVLVDYAHTPDALSRAIEVLRPLSKGRLVVVFGCGGDRDREKRPLMGTAVAQGADLALVTSDNPRTENPQQIIDEILPGVAAHLPLLAADTLMSASRGYFVEPNRRHAIDKAVALLEDDDVLLIAGKGHEDYQIIGTERHHFDDGEQARRALRERAS